MRQILRVLILMVIFPLAAISQNWQNVYTATGTSYIKDIDFTTPEKGIAVGSDGFVIMTIDAGDSWQ